MDYTKLAGITLGGYELQELISQEANIVATYRAYQSSLKRDVAVQILSPELQQETKYRQGFEKAAAIIAALEHPNIAPIHDYGTDHDLTYAVMRLMAGGQLRHRLQQGAIPLQQAASIIKQVGHALEYVHSRDMVHGDPSIANIVFDQSDSAYIADFIVAGFSTEEGLVMGTLSYMAPEKWLTGKPTPATDQYALGCIAYHMITGHVPFTGDVGALRRKHQNEIPPLPQYWKPEIPQPVTPVLRRAMDKKPEDRYPTVMDFVREFEKAINSGPQHLFISYSRRDQEYARQLREYLQHSGLEVWIDDRIDYGDRWFNEIEDAIRTCAAFLVIMTPQARDSEWVQKEILLAKRDHKPIFPLLLDGEEFGILIDVQFADVRSGQMPDAAFHRRLGTVVFGTA